MEGNHQLTTSKNCHIFCSYFINQDTLQPSPCLPTSINCKTESFVTIWHLKLYKIYFLILSYSFAPSIQLSSYNINTKINQTLFARPHLRRASSCLPGSKLAQRPHAPTSQAHSFTLKVALDVMLQSSSTLKTNLLTCHSDIVTFCSSFIYLFFHAFSIQILYLAPFFILTANTASGEL